jgi:nucleoside 2-deoxyribosyltransferase
MSIKIQNIVYIAHRLFALHDRGLAAKVAERISEGLSSGTVFLPYCDTQEDTIQVDKKGKYLFECDLQRLQNLAALVAILHGPSYDDGTCMEVGFAYGKQTPLIFLLTDFLSYSFGNAQEQFNHPDPLFSVLGACEVRQPSPILPSEIDFDETQQNTYKNFYYRNLNSLQAAIEQINCYVFQTLTAEKVNTSSSLSEILPAKQLYIEPCPYNESSVFDQIAHEVLEMGWSVYKASRLRLGTTQAAQTDLQEALKSHLFLLDGNGFDVPPGSAFLTGLGLAMKRSTILYYTGSQITHAHGREPNERNLMLLYGCSEFIRTPEALKQVIREKLSDIS